MLFAFYIWNINGMYHIEAKAKPGGVRGRYAAQGHRDAASCSAGAEDACRAADFHGF